MRTSANFTSYQLPAAAVLVFLTFFVFNNPVFSQSGQKYSTGLNTLFPSDGLGSLNYEGLNFYTNNIKRSSFTKDGAFYLLTRGSFLSNIYCDSLLTSWKISTQEIQTVTAIITGNAQIGGTLTIGGVITIDGVNSRISSSSGTIDFDANNLTTTGNISAGNLNTMGGVTAGGLTVNNTSLFSGSATFSSGLSASQISAGGLSVSGTTTLNAVVLNDGVTMPPLAGSGKGLIQFNNSGQLPVLISPPIQTLYLPATAHLGILLLLFLLTRGGSGLGAIWYLMQITFMCPIHYLLARV